MPLTLLDLGRLVYPTFKWAAHHVQIADALTDVAKGKVKRLLVSCPPQHGKSTLTRLFLSWLMMSVPDRKLMLLSYGHRLAASHSVAARDITRRWGPALFGHQHISIQPDSKARDLWRTHKGGYCVADSIQGAVTGWAADGVVIDDVYKGPEDSSSEAIRQNVEETYASVIETRLAPDGFVVIINTPWTPEGLPQKLLRTEPQLWTQLSLPALDADDNPLWGDRYDRAWYLQRREQFESRGMSYLWQSLYMQDPKEAGGRREFPAEWLTDAVLYEQLPADDPVVLTVLAVDPSLGKAPRGDYSAVVTARLLSSRRLFVECDLQRRPVPQLEDAVVAAHLACRPQMTVIEANAFAAVIADNVKRKVQAADDALAPNVVGLAQTAGGGSTKPRIRVSLSPLLAQGRLHVKNDPGGRLLLQQLREFPGGLYDDGPDAVELACQGLNVLLTGSRRQAPQVLVV